MRSRTRLQELPILTIKLVDISYTVAYVLYVRNNHWRDKFVMTCFPN